MLNEIVGFTEGLGSRLGILAIGETVAQRQHAAAGPVAGIDHRDLMAGLDQFVSRGESRESRTGDEDVFRRTSRGNRCSGYKCGLKKIAPGEIAPGEAPVLHDGIVGALTAAGGAGFFRAAGRNAQHQIATLAR